MNLFKKVSLEQYLEAVGKTGKEVIKEYEDIKIPSRGTKYSAGYDFYAPYDFTLAPGETIKIATGIRVILDSDKFLAIVPRSGLGFKYRLQLNNTVGKVASITRSKNHNMKNNMILFKQCRLWLKLTENHRE